MSERPALGIIGGSGLYGLAALQDTDTIEIETPFGRPSDAVRIGRIGDVPVAFISRHGAGHHLSPSHVPYAANICAMKMLGVTHLVSISAVGSLREELAPRSFVIPDQTFDRTIGRTRSFFEEDAVAHVSMANPFCPRLSELVANSAVSGGLPVHRGGTYVCIEGPQFSTKAESALYRVWDASIIGMTALPEARLAREAELCYACLAMVTDYDVWHEQNGPVNVDEVVKNLSAMTTAVQSIVVDLVQRPLPDCSAGCQTALAGAIITAPQAISEAVRERLQPIAGRYLSETP